MRLEEYIILVTRAANDVGKVLAETFASEGATVICNVDSGSNLDKNIPSTVDGPGTIVGIEANLHDENETKNLLSTIENTHGIVDVLVNNTALVNRANNISDRWRVDEHPADVWDDIIEANLRGGFLLSREVLSQMRREDQGQLIHLTTELGSYGYPQWGPYVAAAHAIEGLHKTIAVESAGTNVNSMLFRPPRGATRIDIDSNEMIFDPSILSESLVKLAAIGGENGEYYIGTEDGKSFASLDENGLWPLVDTREQVGPGNTLSWSVDLHIGDQLVIDVRSIEGTVPVVAVNDPNGETIVEVDDMNIGEQIRQQLEVEDEGRYDIEFQNEAPLASGQWDITLSLQDQD